MSTGIALIALTVLFFGRVAGQLLVAVLGVSWLPPMEAWFSGYLPYSILLPIQLSILGVQATIDWQVCRGGGWFARRRPRAGRTLRRLSYLYAFAMGVRFLVTSGEHLIPIIFHWVLAAYLFVLSGHYMRAEGPRRGAPVAAGRRLSAGQTLHAGGR